MISELHVNELDKVSGGNGAAKKAAEVIVGGMIYDGAKWLFTKIGTSTGRSSSGGQMNRDRRVVYSDSAGNDG